MKRIGIAVMTGILLQLAGGQNVQAQDYVGCWSLQPIVGYSIPRGDFSESAKSGVMMAARVRHYMMDFYSMDFTLAISPNLGQDIPDFVDATTKGHFGVTQTTVDNNLYFATGRIRPYGAAGLGLYFIKTDLETSGIGGIIKDNFTDRRFGVNLGVGVEALVGDRVGVVGDIKFHTGTQGFRLVTFGVGLNWFLNSPYGLR
jgi:outer membrane autotransporter protein